MNLRWRKQISHDTSDYSMDPMYFVTICTQEKLCRFGKVDSGDMLLSDAGKMVKAVIDHINQDDNSLLIIEYIIMPNHVHFIIRLSASDGKTVSGIIRDFKSYTTREFCKPHSDQLFPIWQRGYHEHRIRNHEEMAAIVDYIRNNPARWAKDKFYVT